MNHLDLTNGPLDRKKCSEGGANRSQLPIWDEVDAAAMRI
jgi:hypothetical protein